MPAEIRESKLISVSGLRHIGFSHFESEECRPLNAGWLLRPDGGAFAPGDCARALDDLDVALREIGPVAF